jgi:hypothetical protein
MENPSSWRLLKMNSGYEMEEAVFTVQGIIISKDLPPIYEKPRYAQEICIVRESVTASNAGYQSIALSIFARVFI